MGRITFRQFPPGRPKPERSSAATSGSVARDHHNAVLEVACPDCFAGVGQECDGCAVGAFMAHQSRIDVSVAAARAARSRSSRRPAPVSPTSLEFHAFRPMNPRIGDAYIDEQNVIRYFMADGWSIASVPDQG